MPVFVLRLHRAKIGSIARYAPSFCSAHSKKILHNLEQLFLSSSLQIRIRSGFYAPHQKPERAPALVHAGLLRHAKDTKTGARTRFLYQPFQSEPVTNYLRICYRITCTSDLSKRSSAALESLAVVMHITCLVFRYLRQKASLYLTVQTQTANLKMGGLQLIPR